MSVLKITAKGQITLKKDVLEHLGLAPGASVTVEKLPNGRLELRAAPSAPISKLFGTLKAKNGRTLSIDEMNEIARQGWAGRAHATPRKAPNKR